MVVAGELWWNATYEDQPNVRFDPRFIPDSEIASYFAAADVVLTPYRSATGKFSSSGDGRHVYGEEFVLIAAK